jgi:hypothetical protein
VHEGGGTLAQLRDPWGVIWLREDRSHRRGKASRAPSGTVASRIHILRLKTGHGVGRDDGICGRTRQHPYPA